METVLLYAGLQHQFYYLCSLLQQYWVILSLNQFAYNLNYKCEHCGLSIKYSLKH